MAQFADEYREQNSGVSVKLGYVGGPGAGLGLFVNFNIKNT